MPITAEGKKTHTSEYFTHSREKTCRWQGHVTQKQHSSCRIDSLAMVYKTTGVLLGRAGTEVTYSGTLLNEYIQ